MPSVEPQQPEDDQPRRAGARASQAQARLRGMMFETRSQAWREAGLLKQISPRALRRARLEMLLLLPLFVGVAFVSADRTHLLTGGAKQYRTAVQIVAVILLMILGWVIARAIGRAFGPALFRRMEPATAGTVGFVIRLVTIVVTFAVALRVADVQPATLAVGGAFTAVIVGLAAQQTLGNVVAATILQSARPFRVGDSVRLQGGSLGGPVEGVVSSLGLFYTTFVSGEDSIMIPNSLVMSVLVILDEGHGGLGSLEEPPARRPPAP